MLTAKLILERLDRDYKVLERREQPSMSFVENLLSLLYCAHARILAADPYSITDIDNTARDIDSESTTFSIGRNNKANLMIGSAAGDTGVYCMPGYAYRPDPLNGIIEGSRIGIQVGTGTTAPTPTDNFLETRILHGKAEGQLEYGGCELVGIAFTDPDGEFTIRRYFTNASGGSITVNEVGIHAVGTQYKSGSPYGYAWAFLIARDIVSPGVAVADGGILRVTYVPKITV